MILISAVILAAANKSLLISHAQELVSLLQPESLARSRSLWFLRNKEDFSSFTYDPLATHCLIQRHAIEGAQEALQNSQEDDALRAREAAAKHQLQEVDCVCVEARRCWRARRCHGHGLNLCLWCA